MHHIISFLSNYITITLQLHHKSLFMAFCDVFILSRGAICCGCACSLPSHFAQLVT